MKFYKQFALIGIFLCLSLCAGCQSATPTGRFSVRTFGATGNGHTLDSSAINKAITAAHNAGGGTVVFPAGNYLSVSIRLKSNVALYLDEGATIIAADPQDGFKYDPAEPNPAGVPDPEHPYEDYGHAHWHNSLIWGSHLHDIAILGPGKIWGRGLARTVPPDFRAKHGKLSSLAAGGLIPGAIPDTIGNKSIALELCRNVILRDFTIEHGGWFGILATGVDNMTVDDLRIDTNRDGMDIDCCQNVRISNCFVNSPRDDGICLKSSFALGYARPCKNITIDDCQVSGFIEGTLLDGTYRRGVVPGQYKLPAGRIKFGTESNGGFENIAISNCVFEYSRGLALESVDGARLEDVSISNITMRDIVNSPIFIRLGSRMRGPAILPVGTCRRINISNVVVYNAAPKLACIISGIPGHDVRDLQLSNIRIVFQGGGTRRQATSRPAEHSEKYPEPNMFGDTPAYGFYIRHASNITFDHIDLTTKKRDARSPFVLDDVHHAQFDHINARHSRHQKIYQLHDVTHLQTDSDRRAK